MMASPALRTFFQRLGFERGTGHLPTLPPPCLSGPFGSLREAQARRPLSPALEPATPQPRASVHAICLDHDLYWNLHGAHFAQIPGGIAGVYHRPEEYLGLPFSRLCSLQRSSTTGSLLYPLLACSHGTGIFPRWSSSPHSCVRVCACRSAIPSGSSLHQQPR